VAGFGDVAGIGDNITLSIDVFAKYLLTEAFIKYLLRCPLNNHVSLQNNKGLQNNGMRLQNNISLLDIVHGG
jgi:hypothetical protein